MGLGSDDGARQAGPCPASGSAALLADLDRLAQRCARAEALAEAARCFSAVTTDHAALLHAITTECARHIGDVSTLRLDADPEHGFELPVVARSHAEVDEALAGVVLEAPLRVPGRSLGVVTLRRGSGGAEYSVGEQELLAGIADLAALAVVTARLLHAERASSAERARSHEQFLDSIIENIPDMIFVKDAEELRFVRFNRAGEALLGFERANLLGKNDHDFFPRAEADAFTRRDREVLAGRSVVDIPAEPIHTRLRGMRTLHTKKIPVLAADGTPRYLLGISEDITEREQMRAALTQSERLASLGMLSAGIAHEINNPLAYVAGNLHVIERDTKAVLRIVEAYEAGLEALAEAAPERAARVAELAEQTDFPYVRENLPAVLARTRDGVRRITRIVDALRSLARTDRTGAAPSDLAELANASLEVVRGRLARRGVEVETDWSLAPTVYCVPTLLSQVLLNLLTNAMYAVESAHPDGGGRIRLASRPAAGGGTTVEVTDNGCGIAPSDRGQIFDPFFTTKPVGEGTGLGLSITHNIIASHGGSIEVESAPDGGTCFRIQLPPPHAEEPA
ncbi:MAG: ATP-binding protein [Deltaproteobacteria bacterium]|nr:ATP-binding protein [Myxococcales bacterium]MDP3220488.1 ATP-binding protein [Deltaproteobacteria bacterium]